MKHTTKRLKLAADIALALALILVFLIGIMLGMQLAPEKIREIIKSGDEKAVMVKVPAINDAKKGVMSELTAKLKPGSGEVLVNVNEVIAGYELQLSARDAISAAENASGISLAGYDVTFSIKTSASLIEGRSAGAAMAVAVAALLQEKKLNPNVTITGSVDSAGRIESVSMVSEKAEAAKNAGMALFLVPAGQWLSVANLEQINCQSNANGYEYCSIEYKPRFIKIGEGIAVREVGGIKDAMEFFEIGGIEKHADEIYEAKEFMESSEEESEPVNVSAFGMKELSLENYEKTAVRVVEDQVVFVSGCTGLGMAASQQQASDISAGIDKSVIGRPSEFDISSGIFANYGISIAAVAIDELKAETYYARLIVVQGKKIISIDARPTDAIAMAVRMNAPVYVNKALFEAYGQDVC